MSMANEPAKQLVVVDGDKVSFNRKTEKVQLFNEDGSPFTFEGGGSQIGAAVYRPDVHIHAGNTPITTNDELFAELPEGMSIFITGNTSVAGLYESNGSGSLDAVITGTAPVDMAMFPLLVIPDYSDPEQMFNNPATVFIKSGTTFNGFEPMTSGTILPIGDRSIFCYGWDQNVQIEGAINDLNIVLQAIDTHLYPAPPQSGTYTLQSVNGVLSWVTG